MSVISYQWLSAFHKCYRSEIATQQNCDLSTIKSYLLSLWYGHHPAVKTHGALRGQDQGIVALTLGQAEGRAAFKWNATDVDFFWLTRRKSEPMINLHAKGRIGNTSWSVRTHCRKPVPSLSTINIRFFPVESHKHQPSQASMQSGHCRATCAGQRHWRNQSPMGKLDSKSEVCIIATNYV